MRRRLDGLLHGEHAGLRLGPGSDPEELTRYQPGHDVRRIDWKVTARAREPQVWITQAERELDTWLLLDQTASMAFGTIETIARLGNARIFVAAADGWQEAHRHAPGTVVHRYRRQVVVAARDGYVQFTRWSQVPLNEAGQIGR